MGRREGATTRLGIPGRAMYLLAGLLSCGLLVAAGPVSGAAAATAGSLDPTFGNGGKVLTEVPMRSKSSMQYVASVDAVQVQ